MVVNRTGRHTRLWHRMAPAKPAPDSRAGGRAPEMGVEIVPWQVGTLKTTNL